MMDKRSRKRPHSGISIPDVDAPPPAKVHRGHSSNNTHPKPGTSAHLKGKNPKYIRQPNINNYLNKPRQPPRVQEVRHAHVRQPPPVQPIRHARVRQAPPVQPHRQAPVQPPRVVLTDGQTRPIVSNKPYKVVQYRTRYIHKYSAEELIYQVKFAREWRHRTLGDLQGDFYNMFEDIISNLKKQYDLDCKARLFLQHPDLKYSAPVFIALRPLRDLTVESIMQVLERVINSNLHVSLTSQFRIDIGILQIPNGNGVMKLTCADLDNVMNERFFKKSIVVIPKIEDDHTCGARSIVVAMAQLRNDKAYKHLRNPKRLTLQLRYALKLLRDTDISPDRALDISQLHLFETFLDVQIIVYQKPLKDGLLYSGHIEREDKIFLFHSEGHFDVITNITGFLGKRNYCVKCLQPYKSKENHSCINYCSTCESLDCFLYEEYPKGYISCRNCSQTCRSTFCYDKHKAQAEDGTQAICTYMTSCKKCRKRMKRLDLSEHICGTYRCSNCHKENVPRGHLCYMRSLDPPKTSGKFLYYDFECTAGDIHECDIGYKPSSKDNCRLCEETGFLCSRCAACINCKDSLCGKFVHRPCLVVAHTVCNLCSKDPFTSDSKCNSCGSRCEHCHVLKKEETGVIPNPCRDSCGYRESIFMGKDAGEQFAAWLFNRNHANFICLAHNAKSYDGVLLLNHILSKTFIDVKCIYSGAKIISMTLPGYNIRCLDSMSFFPMALKKLPKIFGLECDKGDFPHLFNVEANQNYIGKFPDIKYFDIDSKSSDEREELIIWHESQKDKVYNFREEMLRYCKNDVKILREACTSFRHMVLRLTADSFELNKKGHEIPVNGVDPFACTTLSALCLTVFRSKYLKETYVIDKKKQPQEPCDMPYTSIPPLPFPMTKTEAKKWIQTVKDTCPKIPSSKGKCQKQVPSREENEKPLPQKKGKVSKKYEKKEKHVFESSPIGLIPQGGYTAHDTYSKKSILWLELMQKRHKNTIKHALNQGEYNVPNTRFKADGYCEETNTIYSFHGCHWHGHPKCQKSKLPNNEENILLPSAVLYAMTVDRCVKLKKLNYKVIEKWECDFDKEMKNISEEEKLFLESLDLVERLDIRDGLYGGRTESFRLYWKKYLDFLFSYYDICSLYPFVNDTMFYPEGHPDVITHNFDVIDNYFGVAKVKVLPPRNLFIPVLPYRCNGKLMFPLCGKCASLQQLTECTCSDNERVLIGTFVTPELQKAVEMGYKILKIYEVYHYKQRTNELFSQYIKSFIGLKTEASGYPADCVTDEQRYNYIKEYKKREGITLNPDKIEKKPGLRQIGKAFANNLWGRLSLRDNLTKTQYVRTPDEFNRLVTDPELQMLDFKIINDDVIALIYEHKKQHVPLSLTTNCILSSFTTCYGRLVLYEAMQKLGRRVLYCDTDSIMFETNVTLLKQPTIPLGNYLGEFTDELPEGKVVIEFCSTGPKSYSILFDDNTQITKVRGFTLNHRNTAAINFDVMRNMVLNQEIQTTSDPIKAFTLNPSKICRDKNRNIIYNKVEVKTFSAVYTKRVILEDLTTLPYGYDWV